MNKLNNILGIQRLEFPNPDIIGFQLGKPDFIPVGLVLLHALGYKDYINHYISFAGMGESTAQLYADTINWADVEVLVAAYEYITYESLQPPKEPREHVVLPPNATLSQKLGNLLTPTTEEAVWKIMEQHYYMVKDDPQSESLPLDIYGRKFANILAGIVGLSNNAGYMEAPKGYVNFWNSEQFKELYEAQLKALDYALTLAARALKNKGFEVDGSCVKLNGFAPIKYSYDIMDF